MARKLGIFRCEVPAVLIKVVLPFECACRMCGASSQDLCPAALSADWQLTGCGNPRWTTTTTKAVQMVLLLTQQ